MPLLRPNHVPRACNVHHLKLGESKESILRSPLRRYGSPQVRIRVKPGTRWRERCSFNQLGEIRDRSFENQRHRASGQNLVVAAITLWNTVYLERATEKMAKSQQLDPVLLQHVSPLG
jgi:hypothetical protein